LLATSLVGAALWGFFDGVLALSRNTWLGVFSSTQLLFQLAVLYLPLAFVFACAATLLAAWVRRVPTWNALARAARYPARAWMPNRRAVAESFAQLASLVGIALLTRALFLDFHVRFQRADLAALLLALIVLGAMLVRPGIVALLRGLLEPLIPARSWFALPGFWLILIACGIAAAAYILRDSPLWLVYRPTDVAWAPLGLVLFAFTAVLLLPRLSTRAAGVILAVSVVAFGMCAATYGEPQTVRAAVQSSSVLGARLVAFYVRFADRDGDRHASAFGGDDCDDTRSDVHPGASDVAGDGVDADCFAGDGAPDVAPRGDGAFVPLTRRYNVLLVTIDTLHRGHLGVNGYERPTSPQIDAFARTAVQFEHVVPQSSRSVLSIPAMLSGLYASEIARGDQSFWPAILPENELFAEAVARAGYRTEAYVGTNYFTRLQGFYQGFAAVQESDRLRSPRAEPIDQAVEALTRLQATATPGTGSWLLWTHLMNVHEPYLDDGTASRFGSDVISHYDTEIALADMEFGRLMAALDASGMRDDTVVILASDHGEAFGDHNGIFFHASSLYEDQLASMLFVRVPGHGQPGSRISSPVALLDVAATILNVTGAHAAQPLSSRSLLGCLEGCDTTRPIFAELIPDGPFPNNARKVRRGDQSVIWDVRSGTYEGFDLSTDPHEAENLFRDASDPASLTELRDVLRAWVAHSSRDENRGDDAYAEQFRVQTASPSARHVGLRYPDRLEIVACETPTASLHEGETIRIVCFLQSLAQMRDDLKIVVWFSGPTDPPTDFHGIHVPLNGRYHTDQWRPGELLRDVTSVVVPRGITPGSTWQIHIAVDTMDGTRQWGELDGTPTLSTQIGVLSIAP
jgi:arylsulfatase A-like enzyme